MISNLSKRFATELLKNGNVSEEDYELYAYGLFMLLSHIIFAFVTCIFGLIFRCFIESAIFYITFWFIRKYAGGYHAKTETRCIVLTTLFLLLCVITIRLSQSLEMKPYLMAAASAAAILTVFFCPMDTPEKPLTKKEKKYFRKLSLMILLAIYLLIILSYIFELEVFFAPLCASLILEGTVLLLGKIKSVKRTKSEEM